MSHCLSGGATNLRSGVFHYFRMLNLAPLEFKTFSEAKDFDDIESDRWETPKYVIQKGVDGFPRDLIVWEPFHCHGRSKIYLEDLGFQVIETKTNFFAKELPAGVDVIVTNPPFSKAEEVLDRLCCFPVPSLILLPSQMLRMPWFWRTVKGKNVSLDVMHQRIAFIKDGKSIAKCRFECTWVGLDLKPSWMDKKPLLTRKRKPIDDDSEEEIKNF